MWDEIWCRQELFRIYTLCTYSTVYSVKATLKEARINKTYKQFFSNSHIPVVVSIYVNANSQ